MTLLPAELELAFSTEPLVGWRIWRAERGIDRRTSALQLALELREAERAGVDRPAESLFHYRLRSLTQPAFWPSGTRMESVCDAAQRALVHPESLGPEAQCECGLWAFRSRDLAQRTLLDYADSGRILVLGRVTLWGRIIEQEFGWRAQYGYPLDLEVYGAGDEIATDLAVAYGIAATPKPWSTARGEPGSRAA